MPMRHEILYRILDGGLVAIVRLKDSASLYRVAEAICEGGVSIIEFTLTTPGALEIIHETSAKLGRNVLIGAGSVMDAETARLAILAGAEFVVSPALREEVITTAHRYGKVAMPGAYTPTEIARALDLGADLIKVFPANALGPGYIKAVKAPMPQAPLLPTGGVNLENADAFLHAGAAALAIGTELVSNALVETGNFAKIAANARAFRETVDRVRGK